jgi:hypothetical protein
MGSVGNGEYYITRNLSACNMSPTPIRSVTLGDCDVLSS